MIQTLFVCTLPEYISECFFFFPTNIECGVLQGSMSGLIVFMLHINDIPNVCSILSFHIIADDSAILHQDSDPNTAIGIVIQQIPDIKLITSKCIKIFLYDSTSPSNNYKS